MEQNVFPTKSNLIQSRKSLELAGLGYDLLDKKRNVLLHEMMSLMDDVEGIQKQIDATFADAYRSLQKANFIMGQSELMTLISARDGESDDISIRFRSVMGVEIPVVTLKEEKPEMYYGLHRTTTAIDDAYLNFLKVKRLTAMMAALENSVYRLAYAIRQAQKRANALKNIIIPRLEETVKYISSYLEEKERESFIVLKVLKK